MADATIIQEFLAELGFKVDQKSLGDFTKALKGGATQAVAFGNIWSDVAEGVGKGAADMVKGVLALTQQLDDLYFSSRRLQDTAQNISALGYVYKQMGLSPAAAEKGEAGISQQRAKYGGNSIFQAQFPGAGITASDSGAQVQIKILNYLHRMSQGGPQQAQIAEQLTEHFGGQYGFDWGTVTQWDDTKSAALWNDSIKHQTEFGQSTDAAAKHANTFTEELTRGLDALHWMKVSGLDPLLTPMMQLATSFDQLTQSAAGFFRTMRGLEPGAVAGATSGVGMLSGNAAAGLGGWANGVGSAISGGLAGAGGWFGKAAGAFGGGGGAAAPTPPHVGGEPGPSTPAKGVDWRAGQQLYQLLVGLGADPEMARGAVSVLGSESMGFHPGARPWSKKQHRYLSTAMGFGQWVQSRRDAYTKATGKTVGTDAASQMALLTWELKGRYAPALRALMRHGTAAEGADIWERLFEVLVPGKLTNGRDDYAIDARAAKHYLLASGGGIPGGGGAINQTNNFYISSTEPKASGREVGHGLHSANQRLARSLRPGVLS